MIQGILISQINYNILSVFVYLYNIVMEHCIDILARRYPQILMPIEKDIRLSEEYKNVCLRGEESNRPITFSMNSLDKLESVVTPAGSVEILSLRNRQDFVHACQCLGNRCEPVEIPDSTGAMAIFGLNNWDKVRAGLDDYKDSLIILSSGNYSNVNTDAVNKYGKLSPDIVYDNLKKSLGFEEEYGNNFGSVSPKQSYEYDYGLDIGSEFEEEFLDDFTISPEQSFYEIILIKPKSMDDMDYVFDQIVEEKNPVILDLTFLQKKGINEFRQAGERLKILREQYKAEAILLSQVKNLIIVTPARVKLVKKD